MNKGSVKDLMTLIKIAIPCIFVFLLCDYLDESGQEWLAGRIFVSFFIVAQWWGLVCGLREGRLRPFWECENPIGFACMKYSAIIGSSATTIFGFWFN